ncbi:hypothetical protein [Paludifilum halophilum]|uniref:Uncharacterized protein n=1 Tax=Paludifilum halophilum TaxID=1642702 RepID=A0A235B9P6_9BACL|nr:hypothetical protein [Paludifilum halophilum]OYD09014.1 hypothetical protein CHM34_04365 [Paludifilum halophilum]
MTDRDDPWMTLELQGDYGHLVYIHRETKRNDHPLRAKIKRESLFHWKIYIEGELYINGSQVRGWILQEVQYLKSRAIQKAKALLEASRNQEATLSHPKPPNGSYPLVKNRLWGEEGEP